MPAPLLRDLHRCWCAAVIAGTMPTFASAAQEPGTPDAARHPVLAPEQLLRQFDRDGDGHISQAEAPDRMKERWAEIDADHDGRVTLAELKAREERVGHAGSAVVRKSVPAGGETPSSTSPAADAVPALPGARTRVFVKAGTPGPRADGKSWATAFATVQEALDAAERAGGGEIWAAKGTYKPTEGSDREATFRLRRGVALYGGFAGDESDLDRRDAGRNPTTLSGDIGREGVRTDNAQHVVTGADEAVLDGFIITGGYAMDGGPGGRRGGPPSGGPQRGGPPGGGPIHITPQTVLSGANAGSGAGMLNFQCAPTIRNCVFEDNHAGKGGAMYNMVSRSFPPERGCPAPVVIDCRFTGNSARGRGGAVANDLGTSPAFRGCAFLNNTCDAKGGAVYNDFGCSPALVNCLFAGNRAVSAGAVGNDGASSPLIVHCTFTRNAAEDEGAALYQGTGPANNPVVSGCILWNNLCDSGPAEIYNWHDNDPQVTGSCVQGGYPGEGNLDQDPQFEDPDHGNFRPRPGSPCAGIGHTAAAPEALPPRPEPPPPPGPPKSGGPGAAAPVAETAARILRVSADNTKGPWDGASWSTAFASLTDALAHAAGQRTEIWVARGTYKPTASADRSAAFPLSGNVALYGGFAGRETRLSERNWVTNATVLSGDIGRAGDPSDNAYHVVIGADGAVLDGFVIRDGHADGRTYDGKGGGMINYRRGPQAGPMGPPTGFSPVVRNCTFSYNTAREGGAVYNYDRGSPKFANCLFTHNAAEYGGAMLDRVGVRTELTGCLFETNSARWRAGALCLDYGARPMLADCRFTGNASKAHGGAIAAASRASQLENTIALLYRCAFSGNRADRRGGAADNTDSAVLGFDGCTFSGNRAGSGGGAIHNSHRATAVVLDGRFSGNASSKGEAGIASDNTSTLSRERSQWPSQDAPARPGGFGPPGP